MLALDGNAIGGILQDVFERDMTTAKGVCANCGASRPLAEVAVYLRAPGAVARCPSCGSVLMVFVTVRGVTCVDLEGLAELEPAGGSPGR
jgi:hypothetical protein